MNTFQSRQSRASMDRICEAESTYQKTMSDIDAQRKARTKAARRAEVRGRWIVGSLLLGAIFLLFLVYGHELFSLMPLPDAQ